MATAGVRDELNCSVCWKIYTDPVTLPCGHNYCLVCIERTWDWQKSIEEKPSCPMCRHIYGKQPELNINLSLCNITERFHVTAPDHGRTEILCTYCDSSVAAAKSCLLCETSLCDRHVQEHSKSPGHVLTVPNASFQDAKCSTHQELLRYLCTEDEAPVCVSCCLAGEHRGHKVELLNEDNKEKYIQAMAAAGMRSELTCFMCRGIYKMPVTLPCGHNFCLICIERTWKRRKGFEEDFSCPECQHRYKKRRELNNNMTLCYIAMDFLRTQPQHGTLCSYCDFSVRAAKFCLDCEASLCDYHVQKHSQSVQHKLIDSRTIFRHRVCGTHQKPLEYFCWEDEACVCEGCVPGHEGHRLEKLNKGTEQILRELQENQEKKQRILEVMRISDLKHKLSCSKCREIYTEPVTLPCGHNFCRVCIERTWKELRNEKYFCNECTVRYREQPPLKRNVTLSNITKLFLIYRKKGTCPVPAVKQDSYLTCSVCREIYTEPVTLSCGHNFCLVCIVRTWEEQREKNEAPYCPECREKYWIYPGLYKNPSLGHMVQRVTQRDTFLRVFCTYCLHSAVPATKSCLHCATSMCEDHVTQHSQSPEHELTEPAARCSAHQELLRYLCTEDGAHVCVSCCLAGEHRGHKLELLNEASEIRNIQDKLSCSVCCKIYTEPVTLPCGHNFCLVCIVRTWEEQRERREEPSCPQCGVKYMREMELRKNNTLCNIVPLLVPPPEHDPSCVPKHSKSAEHVSSEPSASPGLTHCSAHRELLRYLCTEDGAPVCLSCCLAGDHRGHKVQMFHEELKQRKNSFDKLALDTDKEE
ncbi:uncharacterized protein LOC108700412 [Xenopus laevis]|uniref:Uncharacterized protein n=2 Tax=Xenopus laevis TaxID=8355 RepID=A0A974H6K3_XENLA|nr:uncharacterized protein LOC108700412 [Xenopus laevis]OCT66677.1 hypothetical protein XELAEV_18042929mg [Xenopus laevis]